MQGQGLRWVQMDEQETNEFLGEGGTGTLSFSTAADEPPFALPVSYGYDVDSGGFYFRLSFPADSEKRDVVDHPTTFVAHGRTDEGWRSVVATGELEEVSEMPYEAAAVQSMWAVDIPTVDIFDRPPEDVTFRQFRLDPETVSGRKEVQSED